MGRPSDEASLRRLEGAFAARGSPPVESWNPAGCADIGLKIDREGRWLHKGRPIARIELVRLFSTVLRCDPEGHVLVTPVEKVRVEVEDAPFLAVELEAVGRGADQELRLRTTMDDWTIVDRAHPLRFERERQGGLRPYVLVRGHLWARLARPLLVELVDLGEVRTIGGARLFGVASRGDFFQMGEASELEELS